MYAAGPAMQATENTKAATLAKTLRIGAPFVHAGDHLREHQAFETHLRPLVFGEHVFCAGIIHHGGNFFQTFGKQCMGDIETAARQCEFLSFFVTLCFSHGASQGTFPRQESRVGDGLQARFALGA